MPRSPKLSALLTACLCVAVLGCDKNEKALHTPADFDPAANISMAKAVEIAEARFPGSFAVAAELDPEKVGYEYEVIVYHEGKYWEVEIDTVDGRIKEVEEEDPAEGDIELAEDDERDAAGEDVRSPDAPSGPEDDISTPGG